MKTTSKTILAFVFVFITSVSFAPPPAPGGGMNPACWPICVPIDKGFVFLIIVVVLYTGIKLYNFQKRAKAKI